MTTFHIGCAGWSYVEWKQAGFYPQHLPSPQFLSYYSRYFDFVELNNSFYQIPSQNAIKSWDASTPDNFSFSIKIWQKISHQFRDYHQLETTCRQFFHVFYPLKAKISGFLLQFPPKFKFSSPNRKKLHQIQTVFPKWGHYFLELRHDSWYDPDIIVDLISPSNFSLVTNYVPYSEPKYDYSQKIQYIRMIGDRSLTHFDHTQRPQKSTMNELFTHLHDMKQIPRIEDIFVIFNNHFRGFAPHDVNELKKHLNISFRSFQKNKTINDFL